MTKSGASDYIKQFLIKKAQKRSGKRFFGEAYIASQFAMREGWYNSFKWLTGKKWLTANCLEPEFERPFHEALMKYFGLDMLRDLQDKAKIFYENHESELEAKKPVAPDLLMVKENGDFQFVESKLPGDTIRPSQIAGMALIKKYLNPQGSVEVSVCNLHPDGGGAVAVDESIDAFSRFYEMA